MYRKTWTREEVDIVFNRISDDGGRTGNCSTCHNKINKNARSTQFGGSWEMSHIISVDEWEKTGKKGNPHQILPESQTNVIACCRKCNRDMKTMRANKYRDGMEYKTLTGKTKDFVNRQVGDVFDMRDERLERTEQAEIEDFKRKLMNNGRNWALEQDKKLVPLHNRYIETRDPAYRKYFEMCKFLREYYRR